MSEKIKVMLVTEGTYPYNGGGVSTWSHILCSKVSNVDYTLFAINANFEKEPRYEIPETVKSVIQVPVWSPDEPQDYLTYSEEYYKVVAKKESAFDKIVNEEFIPAFEDLLQFIYGNQEDLDFLDFIFYRLWLYLLDYDFKETMRSKPVWDCYKNIVGAEVNNKTSSNAILLDLTTGMRWIYRFLIPLSITNVPNVNTVHLTLSGFTLLPGLTAHYRHGSSIILTEHGVFIRERLLAINNSEYPFFLKDLLIRFSEAIARLTYYKSEKIISVNAFNAKWEKRYGADQEKIQIIYNGVDHHKFIPREKPNHLNNTPTVVALARVFELKDIFTMIESCAVVVKKIPNVQFLIYGDDKAVPKYTAECNALIKELSLQDNFKFMGPKPNPHLLFCEGDISILTSISEGFPYTVIESMSCGIPVVATDVGGVKEALDEQSGFLCKPKDAEDIGNKVITLLKDKSLREKMSANARQRVVDNFTEKIFITDYEKVYDEIYQSSIEGRIYFVDNNVIKQ